MADYQPFHSGVGISDVIQQRNLAAKLADRDESEYPDNTYEEGVLDTLRWLMSAVPTSAPLDSVYDDEDDNDD